MSVYSPVPRVHEHFDLFLHLGQLVSPPVAIKIALVIDDHHRTFNEVVKNLADFSKATSLQQGQAKLPIDFLTLQNELRLAVHDLFMNTVDNVHPWSPEWNDNDGQTE